MTITTASTEEQSIGISAWLTIPRDAFDAARRLSVPDRLERTIMYAIADAGADTVSTSVPLNTGEAAILRAAGMCTA